MSDDGNASKDSRHQLPILLGIVGAVLGFVAAFLLALPSNAQDPVTSGLVALFVFGPIGAVIGAFAGAKLGAFLRPPKPPAVESPAATAQTGVPGVRAVPPAVASPAAKVQTGAPAMRSVPQASVGSEIAGPTTRNAFKALGIVVAVTAVVLGGWAFYEYQTTPTPWLRPNGTDLQFEVRLPAGAAVPPANGVEAKLRTNVNTMPAEFKPNLFRKDGDRPVIVGQVDLAFRASWRQIEVKFPGRGDATYALKLKTSPSHMPTLGAWEKHPDGSEIRYRVRWPGKD